MLYLQALELLLDLAQPLQLGYSDPLRGVE
jgi:hypothetical protein